MTERSDAVSAAVWLVFLVDDPEYGAEIRGLLRRSSDRSYEILSVDAAPGAIRAALDEADAPPRCVLLGDEFAGEGVEDALASMSGPDGAPIRPVVVLVGEPEAGRAALRAGAHEYLVRGSFDSDALVRAMEDAAERWEAASPRARTEEAFRAVENDAFRNLVENSPFGVYAVDADFRLVLVSQGASRVFENVRPLLGRDFGEVLRHLWPEPFAGEAIARFRRTLATGEPYRCSGTVERRRDIDAVESYDWKIERVVLPDGRPGVVCHFYDLTDRDRYETAVRESDSRFRRAIDATRAMVYELDSPRGGSGHAYGVEHIVGAAGPVEAFGADWWRSRVHPDDEPARLAELERRSNSSDLSTYRAEYRVRHADGSWRDVQDHAQVLRDDEGRPVRLVGTIIDVTETRKAEERLREADRKKDEFLAMLAHELRNPLAAVVNALQVAKRSTQEQHQEWARQVVERQLKNITRLIDDLLDVSRIARGKLELRKSPIDVESVVEQAIASVAALVRDRGHELTVEYGHGSARVEADQTRLEQIVTNLLNNAAKYSKDNGRIRLETGAGPDGLSIRVEDDGIGIAPDQLPRMFELFTQADPSTRRSEGGLGIGLTLVKRLVELHDGTVSAHSEGVDRGSTFEVRLPLADRKPAPPPASPEDAPERTPRTKLRILVADDNVDSARGLASLLRIAGHDAETAHDGPSAVETARSLRPDAVVMDIGLPGMSGYETIRKLRSEDLVPPRARFVAVTGYGQEQDRLRSIDAGFHHHLTKPVDFEALVRLLDEVRPPERDAGPTDS